MLLSPQTVPKSERDDFAELTHVELDRLYSVQIAGVSYAIWLLDIRFDPRSRGSVVEVKVAARNPSGRHYIGRFHIEADRLQTDGAVRAIETMERVIRGDLPPTARELQFEA